MLPDAFRGHGVFFYQPQEILDKFRNDTGRIVRALREAGMQHVWVRLHDHHLVSEPEAPTARLIAALREQKFALAGWGFVRGEDPVGEATAAAKLTKHHGLAHYVADIEQDEHDSLWTVEKIPLFLQTLRVELPAGAGIAVSSYPYVVGKHPELMRAAAPHADLFNPQIYWHHHPKASMLAPGNLPPDPSRPYGRPGDLHNPVVYADLCLDWWRATVGATPLLPAGQAYWDSAGFTQRDAEAKLPLFLSGFTNWRRLVGFNWWHFARRRNEPTNGAMTDRMYQDIVAAHLASKQFATG